MAITTSELAERADFVFAGNTLTTQPGLCVGVYRDGEALLRRAYGLAELSQSVANTPEARFRIASLTKQFIVMLTLLAEADGELSLTDPLGAHLDGLKDPFGAVSLEAAMRSTAGLPDFYEALTTAGAGRHHPFIESDLLDAVRAMTTLNAPAGRQNLYSNTGFLLAGMILERVMGEELEAQLDRRIFAPLGMGDTALLRSDRQPLERLAVPYSFTADGFRRAHADIPMAGQGGIVSTIDDLARWEANLLAPTVGTPDMVARMHTRGQLTGGETIAHGLGRFMGELGPYAVVSHSGALPGWASYTLTVPDERLSVVALANTDALEVGTGAQRLVEAALGLDDGGSLRNRAQGALTNAPQSGLFAPADGPGFVELSQEADGTPVMRTLGAAKPLVQTAPDSFAVTPTVYGATLRVEGERIIHHVPGRDTVMERCAPDAAGRFDLSAVTGRYHWPDLAVDLVIEESGAVELSSHHGRRRWQLTPATARAFRLASREPIITDLPKSSEIGGWIEQLDAAARAASLILWTPLNPFYRFYRIP